MDSSCKLSLHFLHLNMPKEIQQGRRMRLLVLELSKKWYVVKFESKEKYSAEKEAAKGEFFHII